jgi:hypothetical protein
MRGTARLEQEDTILMKRQLDLLFIALVEGVQDVPS